MTSDELRARLAVWRGRPAWARIGLIASTAIALLMFTWNIGESGLSTYYAASAVSMAGSPEALLVGAVNHASTTTLDKLSGFLLPQALAVRLFGVHAWALSLPQAIEGAVTVFSAYVLGMRWRGPTLAVAAAFGTALTPMLAAMFGRPMEDGLLTMSTVLAVVAAQRGALTGHARWFAVAALWVGIGFQAKMLQAWFILPALLALAVVAVAGSRRRRLALAAGTALLAVALSVSWMTAISLLPAAQRPFADGTTNGSVFSMVFGYNGVDRIVPGLIPGSVPQLGGHGVQLVTRIGDAAHSPVKLMLPEITTQVGWLYPLALAGALLLIVGAIPTLRTLVPAELVRGAPGSAFERGMLIAALLWIGTTAAVLSVASVPHVTYVAPIAVPLVLLAGIATLAARDLAAAQPRGRWRWALPVVLLAESAWAVVIMLGGPVQLRGLAAPVGTAGILAALLFARTASRSRAAWVTAAVLAAIAVGTGPVAWSGATLLPGGGGSASDAYAGPRMSGAATGPSAASGHHPPVSSTRMRIRATLRPPFTVPPDPSLTPEQQHLVDYIREHHVGRELFATDSMPIAVTIILETRDDAIPMGGFSHQAATPALPALRAWIASRTIRYALLIDAAHMPPNPTVAGDRAWVRASCRPVLHGRFRADSPERQTLYDCGT